MVCLLDYAIWLSGEIEMPNVQEFVGDSALAQILSSKDENKFYIAVVGSRDYGDLDGGRNYVGCMASNSVVVTGGARGVDKAAEEAAKARGLDVIVIKPDWEKHGKRAGFVRNEAIVKIADSVIAFWNRQSAGTKSAIELAKKFKKRLLIVDQDGNIEWG